jgi:hypothetical protein
LRTVIARHDAGASVKYLVIGSSSDRPPSSTCIMTATAVNCLPTDPLEDRLVRHRNSFDVGVAVAFRGDDAPGTDDRDGRPGTFWRCSSERTKLST